MRKVVILATFAVLAVTASETRAAGGRARTQVSSGPGPINRVIELERRKNAAIRRIVLGR